MDETKYTQEDSKLALSDFSEWSGFVKLFFNFVFNWNIVFSQSMCTKSHLHIIFVGVLVPITRHDDNDELRHWNIRQHQSKYFTAICVNDNNSNCDRCEFDILECGGSSRSADVLHMVFISNWSRTHTIRNLSLLFDKQLCVWLGSGRLPFVRIVRELLRDVPDTMAHNYRDNAEQGNESSVCNLIYCFFIR